MESLVLPLHAYPEGQGFSSQRLPRPVSRGVLWRGVAVQGGDCAESFKEFHADNIRDTFRVLLQMAIVLTFGGQMPVIKVSMAACLWPGAWQVPAVSHMNLLCSCTSGVG